MRVGAGRPEEHRFVRLARRTGKRPRGVGYPWLQTGYLAAVSVLVLDLLVTKPAYTWGSCAVVLSGLPCYAVLRRWPVSE